MPASPAGWGIGCPRVWPAEPALRERLAEGVPMKAALYDRMGPAAEVLDPAEVRVEAAQAARRLLARYE